MRYVGKLHVLDVMDQIVVSGYVFDADPLSNPDHEMSEFSQTLPSYGDCEPDRWLKRALVGYLQQMSSAPLSRRVRGGADGGIHTVSGLGQGGQAGC
jgi:hypothetical protein